MSAKNTGMWLYNHILILTVLSLTFIDHLICLFLNSSMVLESKKYMLDNIFHSLVNTTNFPIIPAVRGLSILYDVHVWSVVRNG